MAFSFCSEREIRSTMAHEGCDQMDMRTAVEYGNVDRIKGLLNEGVCVNTKLDEDGCTTLMWAARNGHFDCVNCLINSFGRLVDLCGLLLKSSKWTIWPNPS